MKRIFTILLLIIFLLTGLAPVHATQQGYAIKINIPTRVLELYFNGAFIKEYKVGVGKDKRWQTPSGTYQVTTKILDPIWEHPYKKPGEHRVKDAKNNPLGRHWLGFHTTGKNSYYGIHGNNQPDSVGRFVSHGCVRMFNEDIEELFELIPEGTPVYVTYKRYELRKDDKHLYIKIYPDPYDRGPVKSKDVIKELQHHYGGRVVLHQTKLTRAIADNGKNTKYQPIASFSNY